VLFSIAIDRQNDICAININSGCVLFSRWFLLGSPNNFDNAHDRDIRFSIVYKQVLTVLSVNDLWLLIWSTNFHDRCLNTVNEDNWLFTLLMHNDDLRILNATWVNDVLVGRSCALLNYIYSWLRSTTVNNVEHLGSQIIEIINDFD